MPDPEQLLSRGPTRPGMRYENAYVWLIFVAALDVMLTWIVLYRGGIEANVLAAFVVRRFGLPGMVIFKFALVVLVIGICETIGTRNPVAGRRFAHAAVAITCLPLAVGFSILLTHF